MSVFNNLRTEKYFEDYKQFYFLTLLFPKSDPLRN